MFESPKRKQPRVRAIEDSRAPIVELSKQQRKALKNECDVRSREYERLGIVAELRSQSVEEVLRIRQVLDHVEQHDGVEVSHIELEFIVQVLDDHIDTWQFSLKYYDEERKKTLTFLTNNFKLAATTIAQIYKSRWQIELFFKWIKQNLKIKSFLGTSKNAVLI